MALVYQETRAEAVCSLEQDVLVLLNDRSRMKGDLHVRFREKFEVKVLLLTRLRGRRLITASYSITNLCRFHISKRSSIPKKSLRIISFFGLEVKTVDI